MGLFKDAAVCVFHSMDLFLLMLMLLCTFPWWFGLMGENGEDSFCAQLFLGIGVVVNSAVVFISLHATGVLSQIYAWEVSIWGFCGSYACLCWWQACMCRHHASGTWEDRDIDKFLLKAFDFEATEVVCEWLKPTVSLIPALIAFCVADFMMQPQLSWICKPVSRLDHFCTDQCFENAKGCCCITNLQFDLSSLTMYVVSSVVGGWGVVKVLGTAFLYANKERGEIQGHRKWSVSSSERGEGIAAV